MTTRIAITSSLFLGIAMLLIPSAQAMSPATSSVGRHDHASPPELWRGDAVEFRTRSLCDYIGPPQCPAGRRHRQLTN